MSCFTGLASVSHSSGLVNVTRLCYNFVRNTFELGKGDMFELGQF